jgi:hypothetical protein
MRFSGFILICLSALLFAGCKAQPQASINISEELAAARVAEVPLPTATPFDSSPTERAAYLEAYRDGYRSGLVSLNVLINEPAAGNTFYSARTNGYFAGERAGFFKHFKSISNSGDGGEHASSVLKDTLKSSIGQRVTLVGMVELRKGEVAAVRGDDFYVWIDESDNWPRDYVGHRVEVVGVLEERHDLPVFVQKPGEFPRQGVPVPEGTDLHEASRRYVLRDAKWSLLQ